MYIMGINEILFFLIVIVLFFDTIQTTTGEKAAENLTDPLIWSRHRFEPYYLQILRKYNHKFPYEEKKVTLDLPIIIGDNNEIKTQQISYYESRDYEKSQVTQDDIILEALDRQYQSKMRPYYTYSYDNEEDRNNSGDPNLISTTKCNRELDYLVRKLNNFIELKRNQSIDPELAVFFDSYATNDAGVLFGNYHWIGNYRQCYNSHIFEIDQNNSSNIYSFNGRYCVAQIKSSNWDLKIEEKVDKLLKDEIWTKYNKYPAQKYDYARFFRFQVGICLPQSCDSNIFYTRKEDLKQLTTHKMIEPYKSYDLVDLYCLPDSGSELRKFDLSAWLFIITFISWSIIIIFFTFIDYLSSKKIKRKLKVDSGNYKERKTLFTELVSALSLIRNFKRFFSTKSLYKGYNRMKKQDKELSNYQSKQQKEVMRSDDTIFLNGLKVIAMPWILYGHVAMIINYHSKNTIDYSSYDYMNTFYTITTAPFFVDWYFVITGFLTSYLVFSTKAVYKNTPFHWVYSIFRRYIRLAPLYVILFWFGKSMFKYLGDGPLWDYGTNNSTVRAVCQQESWFYPITLTSNFLPLHEECIIPSWYVSSDMQFYVLTPFLLIALAKSPLIGWLLSSSLLIGCLVLRFHRYLTDPRAPHLDLMRIRGDLTMRNNWDIHATYLYPQYRIAPYIVGILTGHYIYMVISGKWTSIFYVKKQINLDNDVLITNDDNNNNSKQLQGEFGNENDNGDKNYLSTRDKESIMAHNKRATILRNLMWWLGVGTVLMMQAACRILFALPHSLDPYAYFNATFIYATDHTLAAFGLAMMFISLMFGSYPRVKTFLSHPHFSIVSKINFCFFLLQIEYLTYTMETSFSLRDMSELNTMSLMFEIIPVLIVGSFMLNLWVETPIANLDKVLLGIISPPRKPRPQEQSANE